MTFVEISIGAVLGANLRYVLGGWIADWLGAAFPFGTLIINLSGSFIIGVVLTLVVERALGPSWVRPMIAIGFLGSYTTFSTFSYETLGLVQSGSYAAALVNVSASIAGALVGVYLGAVVARAV